MKTIAITAITYHFCLAPPFQKGIPTDLLFLQKPMLKDIRVPLFGLKDFRQIWYFRQRI